MDLLERKEIEKNLKSQIESEERKCLLILLWGF